MADLKPKTVKNRIRLLRALSYKGNMVYIRMIGTDLFEWLLVFENQIYSSNMIFTPRKGVFKLSEIEIQRASSLIWAGAVSTIETLLGSNLPENKKKVAEMFEKARRRIN